MLIFLDVLYTQKRVWVSSSMELEIPPEINDHFKIFGKDADEVDYNSIGPIWDAIKVPQNQKIIWDREIIIQVVNEILTMKYKPFKLFLGQ